MTNSANSITKEMKESVAVYLAAKVLEDQTREIVQAYQVEILKDLQASIKEEFKNTRRDPGFHIVLDPKRTYLMNEEDFKVYDARCKAKRDELGLEVENKDHCPLLVAESVTRDAKREILNSIKHITGLDAQKVLERSYKTYEQMTELTIKLVCSHFSVEELKAVVL